MRKTRKKLIAIMFAAVALSAASIVFLSIQYVKLSEAKKQNEFYKLQFKEIDENDGYVKLILEIKELEKRIDNLNLSNTLFCSELSETEKKLEQLKTVYEQEKQKNKDLTENLQPRYEELTAKYDELKTKYDYLVDRYNKLKG